MAYRTIPKVSAFVFVILACWQVQVFPSMPQMIHILNSHAYTDTPRTAITMDTLDLVRQHPWLGIGRSNFSRFIVNQDRYERFEEQNLELKSWKEAGNVPELSALSAFVAEDGIPVVLSCYLGLAKLWRKLYRLRRMGHEMPLYSFALAGYSAWLIVALVAGFARISLRNPIFCLPFFFAAVVADKAAPHGE